MDSEAAGEKLIARINRKAWWHVPPEDPRAYKKRGKWYASSFEEAEFYGRPLDIPDRVQISNPLVGDRGTVERHLFGKPVSEARLAGLEGGRWIRAKLALDAEIRRTARRRGYDAIVFMSQVAYQRLRREGKVPRSIELNLLDVTDPRTPLELRIQDLEATRLRHQAAIQNRDAAKAQGQATRRPSRSKRDRTSCSR
jgi:hypothetical protein